MPRIARLVISLLWEEFRVLFKIVADGRRITLSPKILDGSYSIDLLLVKGL